MESETKPIKKKAPPLLFYVHPGNNPCVIKEVLLKRGTWKECSKEEAIEKANFLWKPTRFNTQVSPNSHTCSDIPIN